MRIYLQLLSCKTRKEEIRFPCSHPCATPFDFKLSVPRTAIHLSWLPGLITSPAQPSHTAPCPLLLPSSVRFGHHRLYLSFSSKQSWLKSFLRTKSLSCYAPFPLDWGMWKSARVGNIENKQCLWVNTTLEFPGVQDLHSTLSKRRMISIWSIKSQRNTLSQIHFKEANTIKQIC